MATENKLPKGPSNSSGMGATPGTQQTAINNVATGGFNPNMPMAPQLAKQGASSFQKSLMPAPPSPPKAAPAKRMEQFAPSPVVSPGMPMDMGRGYNIFSGMDAGQINQMNRGMGLSNMTALPSLAQPSLTQEINPAIATLNQGTQRSRQVMSGTQSGTTDFVSDAGFLYSYDPETGKVTISKGGKQGYSMGIDGFVIDTVPDAPDYEDEKSLEEFLNSPSGGDEDLEEYKEKLKQALEDEEKAKAAAEEAAKNQEEKIDEGAEKAAEYEEKAEGFYEEAADVEIEVGFPEEQYESLKSDYETSYEDAKENLDEKYAIQLQQMLSGIDRQMAMAGMFGSGAHSLNINNAVAQGLATMASEYADLETRLADNLADLELQNMQQIEQDVLNLLESKLKLGDKFKSLAETIQTDSDEDIADYAQKKNMTTTIIDSVTSEIEAYAGDVAGGVLAGSMAQGINYLEDLYTQKLMDAETPEELQLLESELESYTTDFFALMNLYEKLRNKGDTDSLSTAEKQKRAKQLNDMYGEILTDMGFLSYPQEIEKYPSLMFTI